MEQVLSELQYAAPVLTLGIGTVIGASLRPRRAKRAAIVPVPSRSVRVLDSTDRRPYDWSFDGISGPGTWE
jgi:hypothetical protein